MSSSRKPPPAPKPPTSLSPTVTISDAASLTGIQLIKIGDGSVIHPRAKLISAYGPVTIGNTSIISERASIGLLAASENQHEGVMIGDGVVIEVGAVVQARKVGSGCLIEINAKIGRGAVIGKHCKIGPLCTVDNDEVIPDYTIIYDSGSRRIDNSGVEDLKMEMVSRQAAVLKRLIPTNLAKWQ